MSTTTKLRKSDIPRELLAAFPDYRGHTYKLDTSGRVWFHDLHWSGGTRNQYVLVPLATGAKGNKLVTGLPWCSPTEGVCVDIPEGFAVVCHSFFCGKDIGLTIYVSHPTAIREEVQS